MTLPSRPTDTTAAVAEYLADREGLSGPTRANFVRLLGEAFGVKPRKLWPFALVTGGWATVVAVVGVLLELRQGESIVFIALWIALTGLGIVIAAFLADAQRRSQRIDNELEWRAYCLLLRPLILADRPGLLDRNRAIQTLKDELLVRQKGAVLKAVVRAHGISLWGPAALGWGCGTAMLVAARISEGPRVWAFGIPVLATALCPAAWCLFRLMVFRRMKGGAGESG
jgi:hypothetical protein